jgi:hypothetical protein
MNENFAGRGYEFNPEDYDNFLSRLREKEREEIDSILLRYSLYKP